MPWLLPTCTSRQLSRVLTRCRITSELMGLLNEDNGRGLGESPVSPQQLGSIVDCVAQGEITGRQGKLGLDKMYGGDGGDAQSIAKAHGWQCQGDDTVLEELVRGVLAEQTDNVAIVLNDAYRAKKVRSYLVGQVIKRSGGKAHPKRVTEILSREIESQRSV